MQLCHDFATSAIESPDHDADWTVMAENSETVTPFPFQGARRAFGIAP